MHSLGVPREIALFVGLAAVVTRKPFESTVLLGH